MVPYQVEGGHCQLIDMFFRRVLAREQEVAEIRMYQPAHVNNAGEHCHNASTARKGQSHPRGKKAKPAPVRCPRKLPPTSQITLLQALTRPLRCQSLAGPALR